MMGSCITGYPSDEEVDNFSKYDSKYYLCGLIHIRNASRFIIIFHGLFTYMVFYHAENYGELWGVFLAVNWLCTFMLALADFQENEKLYLPYIFVSLVNVPMIFIYPGNNGSDIFLSHPQVDQIQNATIATQTAPPLSDTELYHAILLYVMIILQVIFAIVISWAYTYMEDLNNYRQRNKKFQEEGCQIAGVNFYGSCANPNVVTMKEQKPSTSKMCLDVEATMLY